MFVMNMTNDDGFDSHTGLSGDHRTLIWTVRLRSNGALMVDCPMACMPICCHIVRLHVHSGQSFLANLEL